MSFCARRGNVQGAAIQRKPLKACCRSKAVRHAAREEHRWRTNTQIFITQLRGRRVGCCKFPLPISAVGLPSVYLAQDPARVSLGLASEEQWTPPRILDGVAERPGPADRLACCDHAWPSMHQTSAMTPCVGKQVVLAIERYLPSVDHALVRADNNRVASAGAHPVCDNPRGQADDARWLSRRCVDVRCACCVRTRYSEFPRGPRHG